MTGPGTIIPWGSEVLFLVSCKYVRTWWVRVTIAELYPYFRMVLQLVSYLEVIPKFKLVDWYRYSDTPDFVFLRYQRIRALTSLDVDLLMYPTLPSKIRHTGSPSTKYDTRGRRWDRVKEWDLESIGLKWEEGVWRMIASPKWTLSLANLGEVGHTVLLH